MSVVCWFWSKGFALTLCPVARPRALTLCLCLVWLKQAAAELGLAEEQRWDASLRYASRAAQIQKKRRST